MTEEKVAEILSDIRAGYNLFGDEEEVSKYHSLSIAIQAIKAESEEIPPKMEEIEWDTQFVIAACGSCGTRLLGRSEDITNYFKYCSACGRKVKWDGIQ